MKAWEDVVVGSINNYTILNVIECGSIGNPTSLHLETHYSYYLHSMRHPLLFPTWLPSMQAMDFSVGWITSVSAHLQHRQSQHHQVGR